MTVSTTNNRDSFAGNGSTTAFPTTFAFFVSADLEVTLRDDATGVETLQVLTTNYTVTGGAGSTGTVNMIVAPPSGKTLVIRRVLPKTQSTDYVENDPFTANSHEEALDRLVMLVQELDEKLGRAALLKATSALSGIELPEPGDDEVLKWNSGGTALETAKLSTFPSAISVLESSPADNDFLVYDTAKWRNKTPANARTAIGAPGLADNNTFTGANTFNGINSFTKQQRWAKGADIASAAALAPGTDGNYFDVTGTTTITSISAIAVGTVIKLHFDAALTLTHHATNLVLPGGANIVTAAGDEAEFIEYGAGTWRCVNFSRAAQQPGNHVVQIVQTETGAVATGTTAIPFDDTIPQNTEGDQYLSVTITPKNANNILLIRCGINLASNSASATIAMTVALFQDSTADALAVVAEHNRATNTVQRLNLDHKMTAGTVSPTTFKIRAGGENSTTTVNGSNAARFYGGVFISSLTVTEYSA